MQARRQAANVADPIIKEDMRIARQERAQIDNRHVAAAQLQLAEMMNCSPQVQHLKALSDTINNSSRMVAQRGAMRAIRDDRPIQRVIKDNATGEQVDDYDLENLDYYSAEYLDKQINQLRVWSADADDLDKIAEVLDIGPPDLTFGKKVAKPNVYKKEIVEETFEPTTVSELSKAKEIKPYIDLIDHLSGEGGKKEPLSGGHLLLEMKAKFSGLVISGTPSDDGPWEGWWSDGIAPPKWSSFFPAAWTKNELIRQLWGSATWKSGRTLRGGINVSKTGKTFYPWVDQTLPKPKLSDMRAP